MKRCRKCERDLPATAEAFNRAARRPDGLADWCRECQKAYYQANKERHAEVTTRWRAEHPDQARELARRSYWRRHDDELERKRRKRAENPEAHRGYVRKYRATHLDEMRASDRERMRARRLTEPEKIAAEKRAFYERHRDRLLARAKSMYDQADPLVIREGSRRTKAKRDGVSTERLDYAAILERDQGLCHICGEAVSAEDLCFEHIVPTTRGGAHSYENVAVSHLACNSKKRSKIMSKLKPVPVT